MGIFSIYVFLVTKKVNEDEPTDQGIPPEMQKQYKTMRLLHIIYLVITVIISYLLPILVFYENGAMYSYGLAVDFVKVIFL